MKRLLMVLLIVSCVASMAMAKDIVVSLAGTATLEWGFKGQLLNTTKDFMGDAYPSGDFYSAITNAVKWNPDYEVRATLSVAKEDGTVVMTAQTGLLTAVDPVDWVDATAVTLVYDFINFPNVVAGKLGIKLNKDTTLAPGQNTPAASVTTNEHLLFTITPIEQLTAVVGLMVKPDNKLTASIHNTTTGATITTGTFVYDNDWDGDQDEVNAIAIADTAWDVANYLTFAASADVSFKQTFGEEAKDSITLGFGTVYDIGYFNGAYYPDILNAATLDAVAKYDYTKYEKTIATLGKATSAGATDEAALVTQKYGAISVNALSMKDLNPTDFSTTLTAADTKVLRTNEVLGRVTIPVGVNADLVLGGLTVNADVKARLAEGRDISTAYLGASAAGTSTTNIISLTGKDYIPGTDVTKNSYELAEFGMPLYIYGKVAYSMKLAEDSETPITIAPNATFQYSSDYWKWAMSSTKLGFAYAGRVSAAKYIGRPMSIEGGVSVTGIAGKVDISLTGSYGFGDFAANHGFGLLTPTPLTGAMYGHNLSQNYTVTYDSARAAEYTVYDNTLQQLVDYWRVMINNAYAADFSSANTNKKAASGSDGINNQWFGAGTAAMDASLAITVKKLIDNLTIVNTTTYTVDNLGITNALLPTTAWATHAAGYAALFGTKLNSLINTTDVTYVVKVGETVAFNILGQIKYTALKYETEKGMAYVALRGTGETVAPGVFEFDYSEAAMKSTLDYKVGVSCTVTY